VEDQKKMLGARFAEERARLGLGMTDFAERCRVSRQQVGRIERGENAPSAELLSEMHREGFDIVFVLTGERGRAIDLQVLGTVEAALRYAYLCTFNHEAELPLRSRAVALTYNTVMMHMRNGLDVVQLASKAAMDLIGSYSGTDDPTLLERNLFVGQRPEMAGTQAVKIKADGKNHRIAGGDYYEKPRPGPNRKQK
jgi:transcriptional regulator with XRE-family HTH domain